MNVRQDDLNAGRGVGGGIRGAVGGVFLLGVAAVAGVLGYRYVVGARAGHQAEVVADTQQLAEVWVRVTVPEGAQGEGASGSRRGD